jgi:hypothetical protein
MRIHAGGTFAGHPTSNKFRQCVCYDTNGNAFLSVVPNATANGTTLVSILATFPPISGMATFDWDWKRHFRVEPERPDDHEQCISGQRGPVFAGDPYQCDPYVCC